MKTFGRMKDLVTVNLAAQKMVAYHAYMSVFINRKGTRPLGSRLTTFDRVCRMLCACSMSGRMGGTCPEKLLRWHEVASGSYRDFPFTDMQYAQMGMLRRSLRDMPLN